MMQLQAAKGLRYLFNFVEANNFFLFFWFEGNLGRGVIHSTDGKSSQYFLFFFHQKYLE